MEFLSPKSKEWLANNVDELLTSWCGLMRMGVFFLACCVVVFTLCAHTVD